MVDARWLAVVVAVFGIAAVALARWVGILRGRLAESIAQQDNRVRIAVSEAVYECARKPKHIAGIKPGSWSAEEQFPTYSFVGALADGAVVSCRYDTWMPGFYQVDADQPDEDLYECHLYVRREDYGPLLVLLTERGKELGLLDEPEPCTQP